MKRYIIGCLALSAVITIAHDTSASGKDSYPGGMNCHDPKFWEGGCAGAKLTMEKHQLAEEAYEAYESSTKKDSKGAKKR